MKLNGKVGIVTGGAKGIGKAFCNALLNEGMKVSICDINENSKHFHEEILKDQKNRVIFCKCDVSSESEFRAAFDKTIKTFGRIDLLINNAGILNEHEWERVIDVNFVGVINGIHLAFEYMGIDKGGSGGTVINTGSNTAFEPIPLAPVYSGCKHGVLGLTRSYGTDYHFKKTGVTVSSVCPGPVDTELFHAFPAMSVDEKVAEEHNKRVKPIKPEEVAKAMLQLLHDEKNGALLRVDADGMRYV